MDDEEKRSKNRERVRKHRAVKKSVEETMRRRSRCNLRQHEERSSKTGIPDPIVNYGQQNTNFEIVFPIIDNENGLSDDENVLSDNENALSDDETQIPFPDTRHVEFGIEDDETEIDKLEKMTTGYDAAFDDSWSDSPVESPRGGRKRSLNGRRQQDNKKYKDSFKSIDSGDGTIASGPVLSAVGIKLENPCPISPTQVAVETYNASTSSEARAENDDFKLILKELRQLAHESRQQAIAIQRLEKKLDEAISGGAICSTGETFERKYSLNLPFFTIDEFTEFDNRISRDGAMRQAFLNAVALKWDERKSLSKNIAATLRKYMTREVAASFNAQKKIAGKMMFKITAFSGVLLDVIDSLVASRLIPNIKESEYLVQLGAVLSNVKDWGVPRQSRRPKTTSTVEKIF